MIWEEVGDWIVWVCGVCKWGKKFQIDQV